MWFGINAGIRCEPIGREPDIASLLTKRESSARDQSSTACWMRGAGGGLQRGSHRVRYQCQSERDLDELLRRPSCALLARARSLLLLSTDGPGEHVCIQGTAPPHGLIDVALLALDDHPGGSSLSGVERWHLGADRASWGSSHNRRVPAILVSLRRDLITWVNQRSAAPVARAVARDISAAFR